MITVWLNGKKRELESLKCLQEALAEWLDQPGCFAIAVNNVFVPRARYRDLQLRDGDRIELLTPMQGG